MMLNYSSNQEVILDIAETISGTYLLAEKIQDAHFTMLRDKNTSYDDLDKSIEEVFNTLALLNTWATSCTALERESFSKDELASLANSIIHIETLIDYGFYVSAAYVLTESAATLKQQSANVQAEFTALFDILNILEELS